MILNRFKYLVQSLPANSSRTLRLAGVGRTISASSSLASPSFSTNSSTTLPNSASSTLEVRLSGRHSRSSISSAHSSSLREPFSSSSASAGVELHTHGHRRLCFAQLSWVLLHWSPLAFMSNTYSRAKPSCLPVSSRTSSSLLLLW
jgi:hypothetical protein